MTPALLAEYQGICYQQITSRYYTIYTPYEKLSLIPRQSLFYNIYPQLYTPMSTASLDIAGITRAANAKNLNLQGQGVILGIADSGIDYTHPAFLDENGKTRILALWDQNAPEGPSPDGISYGREYTTAEINAALKTSNPSIPRDIIGHGTALAGAAGGSEDVIYDFVGAAPLASFVIVKLKPAKKYLRSYYFASDSCIAYQENDIMLAINYLRRKAISYRLPLSIAFGLGCALGDHNRFSALDNVTESVSLYQNACICVPAGNEGLAAKHYRGVIPSPDAADLMELNVGRDTPGVFLEIWGHIPATLSIGLRSPSGEEVSRIPARFDQTYETTLLFDRSEISVSYESAQAFGGEEVIVLRLTSPSEGIWQIFVYSDLPDATYDAYLTASSLSGSDVFFLEPSPDITLTSPGSSFSALTVSGYDAISGRFYPESGRGFTRLGLLKPDLCAPCVGITVPNLRSGYEACSGTSMAAALTAGACAQFLTWGVTYGNAPLITSADIKSYLIRGAVRSPSISYPSREWGYGTLDIYRAFEVLRQGGIVR